jgi:hypothetical protein
MNAVGDHKRRPSRDPALLMAREVPIPHVGGRDRRSFPIAVGWINGQINPTVQIRPGEMQFWRIGHVGATLFIKFRIEGMPLYVVATGEVRLRYQRKRVGWAHSHIPCKARGTLAFERILSRPMISPCGAWPLKIWIYTHRTHRGGVAHHRLDIGDCRPATHVRRRGLRLARMSPVQLSVG